MGEAGRQGRQRARPDSGDAGRRVPRGALSDHDQRRARAAAELLADRCAGILGAAARSVILHGSLAAGGFRPGRSDIDLLAVVAEPLSDARAADLEDLVRGAEPGGAAGIDLHVVSAGVAGAPSRAPALDLHVGRYDRSAAGVEVARWVPSDPDLAVELSIARAQGRALAGAAPAAVIGAVPDAWVVDRGRHWLTVWRALLGDRENAAFMALTACRIWRFAGERVHCPKDSAARWALARDPSLNAIGAALRQEHPDDPATAIAAPDLAALLDAALRDTDQAPPIPGN
ncbi:hypothetical protein GCM10010123_38190 [Pilimelia anulata]|uniref:DUF4111 domain-containing protein n=1 Tax=Pilimelia anulata TaxID=53371 RepID=A0A8J3BHS2_9ACTN|nr:aminoglycoside adenylyltransferase domain-containing protein [Pilimelia anulata]GGK04597.1 hypothetical protein GCM10010123_38190 [Pilimelia anulata]